ncbi:MAG: anti-sigma factor family protein [Pelagimonas sp.]|uniref:anti-sigma factor family protein n=1 Tax=Pelagimonas sp. TaxID=2073170 RepID=UPI003D6C11A1
MTQYAEKLSAFLDGELSEAETREIEQALEADVSLQAELEELMAADDVAQEEFAQVLKEPVPFELAAAIHNAPTKPVANDAGIPSARRWLAAGATAVALLFGGAIGYVGGLSQNNQVAAAPSWLKDIATYHRVYAEQERHLVEVGADEADHIESWLTTTVGANVRVPDLSTQGLTFQGARLLVAAGKPVAQLMFTDADAQVVALCLMATNTPQQGFAERDFGDFDFVTWGEGNANFVIVGDDGRTDLLEIAQAAAIQV